MAQYKILVSDKFDKRGLEALQSEEEGLFEVLYEKEGFNRKKFLEALPQVDGLIIRSASKVDKDALSYAKRLKIIIRAGVGVDNIDIESASQRGIIVENAPGGNTVSTAEQALALLFAAARRTPQANRSVKEGKWEKSKFKGLELSGKTLGVLGLGRIGKEVLARGRALKMKVLAYDPYVPKEKLEDLGVDLVDKESLLSRSDFITVHTPLTETTKDFINSKNLSQLKDGVILINAARGGIYNEAALEEGLRSGKIGAVGLDVFTEEPLPADFPLRNFENCILTPHLGASTGDAEFAVAMETVNSMIAYFKQGLVQNSFNFPSIDPEDADLLRPYYEGAIRVGKLLGSLSEGIHGLRITYYGEIAKCKTEALTAALQYGLLLPSSGEEVNLINAPALSEARGIQSSVGKEGNAKGFSSYVQLELSDSSNTRIELKYTSSRKEALVFSLFTLPIEFRPEGIILSVKNRDMPGVVGTIGTFLGREGANIAHLELNRDAKGGNAYCIISIDELLKEESLDKLRKLENIIEVKQVDLG